MIFACFACSQPDGLIPKIIHEEGDYKKGVCWGICHKCGIVVCSGHGRRNEVPYEYQCTYCTGDFIERGGFLSDDPSEPTSPGDLQTLVNAISDLKIEIVKYIENSVEGYMRDKDIPISSRFDEDVLKVAAQAYRKVAKIPEKQRVKEYA